MLGEGEGGIGIECLPALAETLHTVVDEVADIAHAGFHGLGDLLVIQPCNEFQPHGLALPIWQLAD